MANPDITIKGNLAFDPELKTIPSGKVLKMRVITNDWFKDSNGEFKNKDTSGWNIEAWDDLAERAYNNLSKGDNVTIMGTIKQRSYEDKNGAKQYVTEVRAYSIAIDLSELSNRKPKASVTTSSSEDIWGTGLETPF